MIIPDNTIRIPRSRVILERIASAYKMKIASKDHDSCLMNHDS